MCGVALASLAPRPVRAEPPVALAAAEAQALRAVVEDPAPPRIAGDYHFVVSNEKKLERFREAVVDRGGMYVGVGTDQNYLLAGWSRPELLVLVDFDRYVVDLHEIYRVFFLHADTPEAFIAMWSSASAARSRALLDRELPDEVRARVETLWPFARYRVFERLTLQRYHFKTRKLATFLTSQEQYDYLVGLLRAGRVHALRGDLTGSRTMLGVAGLARRLGVPVRTLYLSNAEHYFEYTPQLRRNIAALPVDERSIVLRTIFDSGEDFFYMLQPAHGFQAWLAQTEVRSLRAMLPSHAWFLKPVAFWIPGPAPGPVAQATGVGP